MIELTVPASINRLDEVMAFVETELEKHSCPSKETMDFLLAVEEIFVNIAQYAYGGRDGGDVFIGMSFEGIQNSKRLASIRFSDIGKPFNPLEKPDPDISLPAEEREIGGLGIYMVKNLMDNVNYRHINGSNELTIQKSFVV